jgi:putative IMPACT (imprinted ancient) family translation regulator
MLEVLRGREVSDVVAVVTRWFGGVLLGAGGLVRAYGDAVRLTLDEVGVRRRVLMQQYDVVAGHADAGRLESDLRARDVTVLGVDYGERATLRVAVPAERGAGFAAVVAELTGGSSVPEPAGAAWVDA